MRKVIVVPYDPVWRDAFKQEAIRLTNALDELVSSIHHVGSTSIPGIYAKPIIDILLLVRDLPLLDQRSGAMESLGYEVMGEYGIPGRRYFRRLTEEGIHTHHAHAFLVGSDGAVRHLAFRDYMIAHPDTAQAYSDLKVRLMKAHPSDMEAYINGKDPFIREHEALALAWWRRQDENLSILSG